MPLNLKSLNRPTIEELWYVSTSFFPFSCVNFHCSDMILTSEHAHCAYKHIDNLCEYVH